MRVVVAVVLDDAGDHQRSLGATGDLDRFGRALVGMNASEEQEVVPGALVKREGVGVDAVVDGGEVLETRMPIGVADRDVRTDVVVLLVHRDDARR